MRQALSSDAARNHRNSGGPGLEDLDPGARAGAQRNGGGEGAVQVGPHRGNVALDDHVVRGERTHVQGRLAADDQESCPGQEPAAPRPDPLRQRDRGIRVGAPVERADEYDVAALRDPSRRKRGDGVWHHAHAASTHRPERGGILLGAGEDQVEDARKFPLQLADAGRLPAQRLALPVRRRTSEPLDDLRLHVVGVEDQPRVRLQPLHLPPRQRGVRVIEVDDVEPVRLQQPLQRRGEPAIATVPSRQPAGHSRRLVQQRRDWVRMPDHMNSALEQCREHVVLLILTSASHDSEAEGSVERAQDAQGTKRTAGVGSHRDRRQQAEDARPVRAHG